MEVYDILIFVITRRNNNVVIVFMQDCDECIKLDSTFSKSISISKILHLIVLC